VKRIFLIALLLGAGFAGPANAVTIDAGAASTFVSSFQVNDGGSLPAGIIARGLPPEDSTTVQSDLDSPDAEKLNIDNVDIGVGQSIFAFREETTRDNRLEGGFAQNSDQISATLVLSPEPPADFVQREHRGFGSSDVILTSPGLAASGLTEVTRTRQVDFENQTASPFFFSLRGHMSVSARAEFNGADGFARAFTSTTLAFESTNPLDISFAPTSPFLPLTSETGLNAVVGINQTLDILGSGMVGLTAFASALGTEPDGEELGIVFGGFDYVMGITLLPGEILSMRQTVSYRDETFGQTRVAAVPLPAGLPLLAVSLVCFGLIAAKRSGKGRNGPRAMAA